jgi:hypothetical protein
MRSLRFATVFWFIMFGVSPRVDAAEALLECVLETGTTVVKIENSLFGNKNVYFSTKGDWIKREVYKQNDEYIWVRSDYSVPDDHKLNCGDFGCEFDFQISLIEHKRGKRKVVYIYRVADEACSHRNEWRNICEKLEAGDRLHGNISCKILQPFN